MLDLIIAGGWLMWPILAASVAAAGICIERVWTLSRSRLAPPDMLGRVRSAWDEGRVTPQLVRDLRAEAPLGRVLSVVLVEAGKGREVMKEAVEEVMEQIQHELERFLTALGIIAEVSPLLGLLGTVVGMIKVFSVIMAEGTGQANLLAGGISEALVTTAAGIAVAIPSMIFYRLLNRRVETICLAMEHDAHRLVEHVLRQLQGRRATDRAQAGDAGEPGRGAGTSPRKAPGGGGRPAPGRGRSR